MTEVRCRQLRERDYFDADYDLKYDSQDRHWCLFFKHHVIPLEDCKLTCPGYTVWSIPTEAQARSGRPTIGRSGRISATVNRRTIRKEISETLNHLANSVPSETQLAESEARAAVAQQERLEELRKPQLSLRQRLHIQNIEDKEEELRARKQDLVGEIAFNHWFERQIGTGKHLSLFNHEYDQQYREELQHLSDLSTVDLAVRYAVLLGKSVKRNPLKAILLLHDEIQRLKALPLPPDDTQSAGSSSASRLSDAEQRYVELRERHDALERICALLKQRAAPALASCSDPVEGSDVEDIRRFLETAKKAISALRHELPQIESRLRAMRLP